MTVRRPKLYADYSRAAILQMYGDFFRFFCDSRFAVNDNLVLHFHTLSQSDQVAATFSNANAIGLRFSTLELFGQTHDELDLIWQPIGMGPLFAEGDWFSLQHHLFMRLTPDTEFNYWGCAEPTCIQWLYCKDKSSNNPMAMLAELELEETASREKWAKFGGYEGWSVTVNEARQFVGDTDIDTLNRLVGVAFERKKSSFFMTRYKGDSLSMHVNSQLAWFEYSAGCDRPEYYLFHPELGNPVEEFVCESGIPLYQPRYQTCSKEQAREIIAHYFHYGNPFACYSPWFDLPMIIQLAKQLGIWEKH